MVSLLHEDVPWPLGILGSDTSTDQCERQVVHVTAACSSLWRAGADSIRVFPRDNIVINLSRYAGHTTRNISRTTTDTR